MPRSPRRPAQEVELTSFESALASLKLDALRRFLEAHVRDLDPEAKLAFTRELVEFAVREGAWRPSRSKDPRLVEELRAFLRVSASRGEASPSAFDALFDRVNEVFLAGEMTRAREGYEALLRPLVEGEISLGQDEMYSEVLRNHPGEMVASYLVAAWSSSPPEQQARALWEAVLWADGLESWGPPLEKMERAAHGPLPGWDAFLPVWNAWVEAHWEAVPGYHHLDLEALRKEAALRVHGPEGLRQLAERGGSAGLWRAWILALIQEKRLDEALEACDTALSRCSAADLQRLMLGQTFVRLALARQDGPLLERGLRAEWTQGHRADALLAWAARDLPPAEALSARVDLEAAAVPKDVRVQAVGHLLAGRYHEVLRALEQPGAGDQLLPAVAWLLLEGAVSPSLQAIGAAIGLAPPEEEDPEEVTSAEDEVRGAWIDPEDALPPHPEVTLVTLLPGLRAWRSPSEPDRQALLSSLERAAEAYIHSATSTARRRAYAHGAHLAVVSAEVRKHLGDEPGASQFLNRVVEKHRRWPAFREELETAVKASPSVRGALPSRRR